MQTLTRIAACLTLAFACTAGHATALEETSATIFSPRGARLP
ncbi:MAG TPA: hypothetical protein VGC21_03680 [Telluria sp.]|jgi:hypothetical protein